MTQVFISYSRRDLSFVEQLVSDLKNTGIDVWYDLSGLEGGSRWGLEIQNAIQASDYVIVVLSPDSIQSEWVEREYLYSSNLKKKLLPVMYRKCELPLSFLNLNYIDVQGENYLRNFEKIKRFLDMESLPPSFPERTSQKKKAGVVSFAVLGGLAVFVVIVMVFLFTAGDANRGPDSNGTNTPVQTSIPPTSYTDAGLIPVMITSTPVQPTATITNHTPTPVVMLTSVPTLVDDANSAVFIQYVESENMSGNWTGIDHALSSDPNVLVFAMSNWGRNEVYNNHLVGVRYQESHWIILNQDLLSMPDHAAFNVQILHTGMNAFIHKATASNITDNWTAIDNPLASDPDMLVFAMPNWSPPDGSRKYNIHPISTFYTGTQWVIFNEDHAPMREGAAFNIQIISPGMNAFVHTATSSNTKDYWTVIEDPLAHDPNKLVFVMPRRSPADSGVYNSPPIGVWYNGSQWTIFNQDFAKMPEGAEFNVLILSAN